MFQMWRRLFSHQSWDKEVSSLLQATLPRVLRETRREAGQENRALANVVYPEPKGPEEEPMPLVIKDDAGQQFEVAPPGLHRAVCADVIDLGVKATDYGPKRKVKFVFQLASRNKQGERFQARCEHTQSLFEGANLRKMLESWRGRTFTEQERKGFDVETVLGVNCQLALQQAVSKSTGRTYAKITAVLPPDKTQPTLTVENYTREVWASEKEVQAKQPEHYDVEPIDEGHAAQYDDSDLPF